jgi:hypothetical protein
MIEVIEEEIKERWEGDVIEGEDHDLEEGEGMYE